MVLNNHIMGHVGRVHDVGVVANNGGSLRKPRAINRDKLANFAIFANLNSSVVNLQPQYLTGKADGGMGVDAGSVADGGIADHGTKGPDLNALPELDIGADYGCGMNIGLGRRKESFLKRGSYKLLCFVLVLIIHVSTFKIRGWGGRIRTSAWQNQNLLPYHLATPQVQFLQYNTVFKLFRQLLFCTLQSLYFQFLYGYRR